MPQPPKYQKNFARPKAEDVFTDREQPFATFEAARNTIGADRPKLLTFFGIGGQGKSALCDALIRKLRGEKTRHTAFGLLRIQGSDTRPHEALLDLRLSMGENSGVRFPAFDIAFSAFWAQAYPEQDLRNYRKGRVGRALDYLPEFAKEVALAAKESVPFLGFFIRLGRWLT